MNEVKRGIRKLRTLDKKINELDKQYGAMLQSAPFGQHSPVMQRTLDKMVKLSQQKAVIWNEMRGFLACDSGKRTLWQKAIEVNLPVARWGCEDILLVPATQIEALLN